MAQEDTSSLEAKFVAAVKVIQSLPEEGPFQPSDDMMLMFYSYYRQATLGPCDIPRPNGFWDTRGKAKWDAWSSLGNMTKEEAMQNYIEDIQLILETMPVSEEVSELVQKLGDFYAEVDKEGEAEDNEGDRRPFTRPFANHAGELIKERHNATMEGYGDLWQDIQNVQESDSRVCSQEGSRGTHEESSDWRRSEEEEENTGEEEEEPGWTVDHRWRSDTRASSRSVEPSVSSFTNGTPSSLNSQVEEEELVCSMYHNPFLHFNEHLSGHVAAVPEKNQRPTDSDNEEFCDSMEHLAMDEAASNVASPGSGASVRQRDLIGGEDQILLGHSYLKEGISARRGGGSHSPRPACSSQRCVSQTRRPIGVAGGNVNEQIASALLRLQRDMAAVLHRLRALEALTQSRSSSPRQEDSLPGAQKFLRPSWWPFDFSPLTVVLAALWPLVSHWLLHLYIQRRRR